MQRHSAQQRHKPSHPTYHPTLLSSVFVRTSTLSKAKDITPAYCFCDKKKFLTYRCRSGSGAVYHVCDRHCDADQKLSSKESFSAKG
jgi:hypothetical protein